MRLALAIAVLAACKGGRHDGPPQDPPSAPGDAAPGDANLDACRAAAARIASLPPTERAQALLDACHPCGDWTALLDWNTPAAEGGPTRAAIERAMLACKAYCEPGAKQRFLGTLDAARGQPTRTPWRFLGELCKAEVSAAPDARFMSAPYFALDRIARALGGPGGDPTVLAAIAVPLPAVSVSGVGLELPSTPGAVHDAGPIALTVDASQILLGALPIATLSATGLAVAGSYPGAAIAPPALAAALGKAGAADALGKAGAADRPAALLAPRALAATRVVEVVAAAGGHPLRLAVAAPGPGGWSLVGSLPVALVAAAPPPPPAPAPAIPTRAVTLTLGAAAANTAIAALRAARDAGPAGTALAVTIAVEPAAKVDDLARLLAALGALDVPSAVLATAAARPSTPKP